MEGTPFGRYRQERKQLYREAATQHRTLGTPAELVRVYKKMGTGIWTFNGTFSLVDGWREESNGRLVFKFRLRGRSGCDAGSRRPALRSAL